MAINRFSTIQGLPEWQPQIPLDILVKGLTYKQELFDKNKALLETNVSLGKSVADLILNDEAKKYTQDKINSYKTYLNTNLAYADLTDDAVMKSADTKLGDVTNDMDIVNWVSKSKSTTKEMNRIENNIESVIFPRAAAVVRLFAQILLNRFLISIFVCRPKDSGAQIT